MTRVIELVGPHGYEHGWVFVGAPGVGTRVSHPAHGIGRVVSSGGGRITVKHDSGQTNQYRSVKARSGEKPGFKAVAKTAEAGGKAPKPANTPLRKLEVKEHVPGKSPELNAGAKRSYSSAEIEKARSAWMTPGKSSIDEHHPRVRAAIDKALATAPTRVHKSLTSVRVVDYHPNSDIKGATTDAVYESTNGHRGKGFLTIGQHLITDKKAEQGVLGAEHQGYLAKTGHATGLDRTVAHELGHHLLDNMSDQEKQNMFRSIFSGPSWPHPAPPAGHGVSPGKLVSDNRDAIAKHIGTYASTDPAELVAELWAMYTGGSDNAYAQLAGEHIEDSRGKIQRRTTNLSANTAAYSSTPFILGPKPLWGKPGFKLPDYIENVAKGLIEDGHDRSTAIQMAIGAIERWKDGGGNVSDEVRAASAKAWAEWLALKTAAGGGGKKSEYSGSSGVVIDLTEVVATPAGSNRYNPAGVAKIGRAHV